MVRSIHLEGFNRERIFFQKDQSLQNKEIGPTSISLLLKFDIHMVLTYSFH